jgi:hypothetical protein
MKFSPLSLALLFLFVPSQLFCKEKQTKKAGALASVAHGILVLTPIALTAFVAWQLNRLTKDVQTLKQSFPFAKPTVLSRGTSQDLADGYSSDTDSGQTPRSANQGSGVGAPVDTASPQNSDPEEVIVPRHEAGQSSSITAPVATTPVSPAPLSPTDPEAPVLD